MILIDENNIKTPILFALISIWPICNVYIPYLSFLVVQFLKNFWVATFLGAEECFPASLQRDQYGNGFSK